MKFTKADLLQMSNLMKITHQGTYTLDGTQALAFADAVRWLALLHQTVDKELSAPPLEIKPLESPLQPVETSKNTKTKTKKD